MPVGKGKNHQLLVEGRDDQEVVYHLCNYYDVPKGEVQVQIFDSGGIEALLSELPTFLKAPPPRLGVMVDANGSPSGRWQAIRDMLNAEHYLVVPTDLSGKGVVVSNGESRVGVWIMPDNFRSGMLENFLQDIKNTGDTLWIDAVRAVNALPRTRRPFCRTCPRQSDEQCNSCNARQKACMHTWLAWQEEPGTPLVPYE